MSLPSSTPKCPTCHRLDIKKLGEQCTLCRACSESQRRVYRFCWACQREWPKELSVKSTCTLPNCALHAALLSDREITIGSAKGCPYFRACPKCKALLTHDGKGCPNIVCPECSTRFCFRCLRLRCLGVFSNDLVHSMLIGFPRHYIEELSIESCDIVKNRCE